MKSNAEVIFELLWAEPFDLAKFNLHLEKCSKEDVNFQKGLNHDTPLHIAASRNNAGAIKALLGKGANVYAKGFAGETPLHDAAEWGKVAAIKALLYDESGRRNEIDIEVKTAGGKTPLHYAAQRGRKDAVKALLEAGADFNAKNKEQETPLHSAVYSNNEEVVRELLKKKPDVNDQANLHNWTPLHYAARFGSDKVISALVEAGAEVNSLADPWKRTPLRIASLCNHPRVFKPLIAAGADLNHIDSDGIKTLGFFEMLGYGGLKATIINYPKELAATAAITFATTVCAIGLAIYCTGGRNSAIVNIGKSVINSIIGLKDLGVNR